MQGLAPRSQDQWRDAGLRPGRHIVTVRAVRRRFLASLFAASAALVVLAAPALAHGDHDARPLARNLEAGPYRLSMWQVYPDAGMAMTPHLIVMFEPGSAVPTSASASVAVDGMPTDVRPSTTTANAWETVMGVDQGDVVTVTLREGTQAWDLPAVVVPPPPTSMLPMQELIYASIALTAGTAWWAAKRTTRAWRRPMATPA
jgi:hypothetical protein